MTFIHKTLLIVNLCALILFSITSNTELHSNIDVSISAINVRSTSATEVEQFDAFFKRFNTNADFQLASIMFPLKKITVDDDNKQTVEYINKRAWKFIKIAKIKGNIINKGKVGKGEVTMLLQIEDTGVHIQYRFVSKEGKWYLTLIADEST
ncbi:DUF4348 domain-containing protein [Mucilaginibacter lacusdianchii]|uniref:DUF4348 domain-containing protein n=1 Tax=Mucilaginibacter lacusdianchii TaxID=2684211 RepID=UPI00131B1EC8|nr:DUF4348 domain-containing protein [Mucilaginibacter sp. JXJ CY 39]